MSLIINQGASSQSSSTDCSTITVIFDQRRKLNFFNLPPPRYTPVSPYPQYTKQQLDMRRKVEILKHNNKNTKGNNLTKKEAYSLLAKSTANQISQFTIQQLQNQNTSTCITNSTKPTWTSACDVPGPPTLLQYDPTVPLYNYVNDATQDANYSSLADTNTSFMHLYTLNEIEYIYEKMDNLETDSSNQNVIVNKNYQTRTFSLGSIVNTKYMPSTLVSYSMNIPIGIWMIGFKDQGVIIPDCDTSGYSPHQDPNYGYLDYRNDCYLKFPGDFTGDASGPPYPGIEFHIDYSISRPSLSIQYSGIPITPLSTPTYYSTLNSSTPKFYDVSFIPYYAKNQFYGLQYVGNLIIDNIVLPVQPEEVYDVSLTMSYSYDYAMFAEMDFFQTGLFFNLTRENMNVFDGCEYLTEPPPYIDMSYSVTPVDKLSTFYQLFSTGTTYHDTSPAIDHYRLNSFGSDYVIFDTITGVYTYFNITKLTLDSCGNEISKTLTERNIGNTYIDRTLAPNINYIFKITPVFNHMTGSTTIIANIKTKSISISATIGEITFSTIEINNIVGNFTYYNLIRFNLDTGQLKILNNLTSSTYIDVNLNPGTYYKYTFIPHLISGDGNSYVGENFVIPATQTYISKITNANYGTITSNSVQIVDISGVFDVFSVIRDGPTNAVYLDNTLNLSASFTDNDTKLTSGLTYSYTIIPSVIRNGVRLDGTSYSLGFVTLS